MNTILTIDRMVKRFAGLIATDHVSLNVTTGHIHALIGPNGAGKSTLINLLCGELIPNEGRIKLLGEDITAWPAAERMKRGLARTFQITSLLNDFTVHQNICLAVQARQGDNFRILDTARGRVSILAEADELLDKNRLEARRDVLAGSLSSGERKQLELLMALAGRPKLLLLDEPMAGLGRLESQQMIETLQGLRGKVSMLLVEHDMEAVYALADRISVLVYGRLILTGTGDDIRASGEVRDAYLGLEDQLC
jgi:branched-chain amino acid transport system ATP-binding protein